MPLKIHQSGKFSEDQAVYMAVWEVLSVSGTH